MLPELEALRGVEQSRFHHLDVYGHTLEVLERTVALTTRPAGQERAVGELVRGGAGAASVLARWTRAALRVAALLDEPLADELTRGEALRWGALLHDAAKPLTRAVRPRQERG